MAKLSDTTPTALTGIDALTGETVELTITDGRISGRLVLAAATPGGDTAAGAALPFVSPGWFDLQVNGWRMLDWNSDDLSLAQAEEMCRLLAASGTTQFLATVITAGAPEMLRRLSTIRRFCESSPVVARAVAGIHVEGPFISSEDGPRGAHDRTATRNPSLAELEDWLDAAGNRIRLVTLAPERNGACEFITTLRDRGIVPALGHTAASAEEIRCAVDAGAMFSTHIGNGISELIHRHRNPIWPQLASDNLSAGIIADTHHLPASMLKAVIRAKGTEQIVAVSDAAAPGGSPTGVHEWAGIDVSVDADGRLGLDGTPYLAGAGHLLDRGVATLVNVVGLQMAEAISTVTVNPRRLLAAAGERLSPGGVSLSVGQPADILAFRLEAGWQNVRVDSVLVEGVEL